MKKPHDTRMRHLSSFLIAVALFSAACIKWPAPSRAHHGWGVFRIEAPGYLEGRIVHVHWGHPHPSVTIEIERPATGTPWTAWTPPKEWLDLGAASVLERVSVDPKLTGRVLMEFGSLHRQPTLGFSEAPVVGERMNAIVFPSCRENDRGRGGALVTRPTLVEYRGTVLSQQSHRLPAGCSGRRTADFK